MKGSGEKQLVQQLLDLAGVRIDGDAPYDIQVHNPDFYPRVIAGGSLALGESYMDGWWDCAALDQFIDRALRARLEDQVKGNWHVLFQVFRSRLLNLQAPSAAFEVGERHYDLGNDLYRAMLDKRLNYTCGYWKDATTLDQAQEAKLELVCQKIGATLKFATRISPSTRPANRSARPGWRTRAGSGQKRRV